MRLSAFNLNTSKETPADAEIVSHQLMLRAGMIRKLASGLYTWSPLGLRVLRRVEQVVREEMDAAGALVDTTSQARAREGGLAASERFLGDNDSFTFFETLGDLIRTGPTDTNVGDLQAFLAG